MARQDHPQMILTDHPGLQGVHDMRQFGIQQWPGQLASRPDPCGHLHAPFDLVGRHPNRAARLSTSAIAA